MQIYLINMKKIFKACKFLLLLCAASALFLISVNVISNALFDSIPTAAITFDKPIIIIDPGHGGEDSGAVGVNGKEEKSLNLELALEIGNTLTDKGYTVVYTRREDNLLLHEGEDVYGLRKISDLKNRCKISHEYENSLFISIHMNSYGDAKYSGLQVYYSNGNDESRRLANMIQSTVHNTVQPDNTRQIKAGKDIYVLENCGTTGVLVECGFLTNPDECEKLSQKEYQKELSFSIVCGIIEYIEVKNTEKQS